MLFIGDIHITTKYTDAIIDSIKSFVAGHPNEKNLIFLGDYMYMFSYDRKALARLFDLFISFWQEGKNVYILAGNHDRVGQQFVYAEGKKITDLIAGQHGVLRFITSPELHTIEGKEILFFPFTKHLDVDVAPAEQFSDLLASPNANERLSGKLNSLLDGYVSKNPNLTVIHHYYMANTPFPGQQAVFHYKDIALSPQFLDKPGLKLISGHIHMPFSYKNYLCTGSVWYTSPLEQNHHKFLFQWDTKNDKFSAEQIVINPYMSVALDEAERLTNQHLVSSRKEIDNTSLAALQNTRPVEAKMKDYSLSTTHLTIISETLSYDQLYGSLDQELIAGLADIALKKKNALSTDLSFTLDLAQQNLQESLVDRKTIVKNFIMSRFGEDFEKYRTLLDELEVL